MAFLRTRMMKIVVAAMTLAVIAAACSSGDGSDTPAAPAPAPTAPAALSAADPQGNTATGANPTAEPTADAAPTATPTADPDRDLELERARFSTRGWSTDFSKRTIPLADIFSGGPGKDGIPAIDNPRFESIADADAWLEEQEPVQVVDINGEIKAYPLGILIWHEIVNDTVGGVPVAITYCPLCNSALTFDRRVGDRVLDFGVSGNLRFSDLIMYDRQTESWWQQIDGAAVIGELVGVKLTFLPSPVVSWGDFKTAHPNAQVLSRNTGFSRPYGSNPYGFYDTTSPFLFFGETDKRLQALDRVVAVEDGSESVAFPFDVLEVERVVPYTLAGRDLVVFFKAGTNSALDSDNIADGRDVGATNVFRPVAGGRSLTFTATENGFVDNETGTLWDLLGQGVTGPLAGEQLEQVVHGNHFWFAWGVFKPDTAVYTGAQS